MIQFTKIKPLLSLFIVILAVFNSTYCLADGKVQIIPQPTSLSYAEGELVLNQQVRIQAPFELQSELEFLQSLLQTGFSRGPKQVAKNGDIQLMLESNRLSTLGEEGYKLLVEEEGIRITAATSAGIFYGIQSLRQLLPITFEYGKEYQSVKIPCLEIIDRPRFPWRALMLDESRHFKGKEVVKDLLDQMAMLKMNTFHWHLTDDQGWRIEIKKYPKLTQIGSLRKDTQVSSKSALRTGEPHSGFYTQHDIKEILEYAKRLHIKVVPEIEMPGHATAAIAAYPWVGTMETPQEVAVTFGKFDDSFQIADPKVVQFLKDILDEVIVLFPGAVIHIGGDEVNFKPLEHSWKARDFMKKKELASPVDLQIYFTNEISNYLDHKGKRMMGWNDIMGSDIHGERGKDAVAVKQKLAKSTIVHFWKGDLNLINQAVEQGYDVVNSNHWDTYLDYTYERIPLSKSYAFDPVPEGLKAQYHSHILGTGAQMWSEWIPTVAQMQKQIFPRLAAYAEVGWTPLESKDFSRFKQNLEQIKRRWEFLGIQFYEEE